MQNTDQADEEMTQTEDCLRVSVLSHTAVLSN